jgi:hypothetical protein
MSDAYVLDIRDHGNDPQRVIDIIAARTWPNRGGVCLLPRGEWWVDNPIVAKGGRLVIRGEGGDTSIRPRNPDRPLLVLQAEGPDAVHDFRIEDLQLIGDKNGSTAAGIICAATNESRRGGLRFLRTHVSHFSVGIHLECADFPNFDTCGVGHCNTGIILNEAAHARLEHCYVQRCADDGIYANRCLGLYLGSSPGVEGCGGWQVRIRGSQSVLVERVGIEDFRRGILLEGVKGFGVQFCSFLPRRGVDGNVENICIALARNPNPINPRNEKNAGGVIQGHAFWGAEEHTVGVETELGSVVSDTIVHGPNAQAWQDSIVDNPSFTMRRMVAPSP